MSKRVVGKLIQKLRGEKEIEVEAPACIEVLEWEKENEFYLGILNEQESSPFIPVNNIEIRLKKNIKKAVCLNSGEELELIYENDNVDIKIPQVQVFLLIELKK